MKLYIIFQLVVAPGACLGIAVGTAMAVRLRYLFYTYTPIHDIDLIEGLL